MRTVEVTTRNPFPGLRPFDFDDSHLFFGRDEQTDALLAKLHQARFVTVLGSSGSGKSSLVRAALLPALEAGSLTSAGSRWRFAIMRPGNEPIRQLAQVLTRAHALGVLEQSATASLGFLEATLRRGALGLLEAVRQARLAPEENLLVVVDQFEELFRFRHAANSTEDEAAAFVKLLLESTKQTERPLYIVLTMRSDFLGDCSQFRDLPETINEGLYLIPRMRRDQLREAITGPVGVAGARIAPRLVQQILNDIGDDPDQLPLLQHALMRTWWRWEQEDRSGVPIDIEHYEAVGGLQAALSLHAEEVYTGLSDDRQRRIAESVFRCLTEKGPDNREVRRPTQLAVLHAVAGSSEAELHAVIEAFRASGRAFLMPPAGTALEPETVVDISHESLIRQWGQLRNWAEDEAESARRICNLSEDAATYLAGEGDLLRGAALDVNHEWWQRTEPNAAWAALHGGNFARAERYLEESLQARQAELEQVELARRREIEHEQERREAQAARQRARYLIVVASLIVVVVSALAWLAWSQRQLAEAKAVEARSRELAFAARSHLEADPELSVILARLALETDQTNEAVDALHEALAKSRVRLTLTHDAEVSRVAFSPDGRILATVAKGNLRLWDAVSGKQWHADIELPSPRGFKAIDWPLAFSPDGTLLATPDGLVDTRMGTWMALSTDDSRWAPSGSIAFSADGSRLMLGGCVRADRAGCTTILTELWDVKERRRLGEQTFGFRNFLRPAWWFSTDGRRLFTLADKEPHSEGKTATLWDAITGKLLREVPYAITGPAAFDLSGHMLAALTDKNTILLAPVEESAYNTFDPKTERLMDIALSANGAFIAALEYRAAPYGQRDYGSPHVWTTQGYKPILLPTESKASHLVFSPDSRLLALVNERATVEIVRIAEDGRSRALSLAGHKGTIKDIAFSPDARRLATASADGTARLWDLTEAGEWQPIPPEASAFALSADGTQLAVPAEPERPRHGSGTAPARQWPVRVWDLHSHTYTDLPGHGGRVNRLAFGPPGSSRLATASAEGTVRVWDSQSGQSLSVLRHWKEDVDAVVFSPDGERLATASGGGTAIWDWRSDTALFRAPGSCDLTFSPDGKLLAGACAGKDAVIWRPPAREEVHRLSGHTEQVSDVAFSPDGQRIATGSHDRTVKIWDTATGNLIRTLSHQNAYVSEVVFSPDGRSLATGAADASVRIWNPDSGEELRTLPATGTPSRIAFTPDGRHLLVATGDGMFRGYLLEVDDLLTLSSSYITRPMTPEERRRYVNPSQR